MKDLELKAWASEAEMLAHVESVGGRFVLIRGCEESPNRYYSSIPPEGPWLGIAAVGHGIEPRVIVPDSGGQALVGYDHFVAAVSLAGGDLVASIDLGGVFFEFVGFDHHSDVLVIHELGVMRISWTGDVRWRHSCPDILTEARIDGEGAGKVQLELYEGGMQTLSIDTGLELA